MYKRPAVIGIRQVTSWGANETVDDVFQKLGANSGNMMFTESLARGLSNAIPCSFSFESEILKEADCIVLAAANWINDYSDLGWIADAVERTKLPAVLVGIGAQSSIGLEMPKVLPGTLRLLKIVSERSKFISARGQFSCEVMEHYGIKNAVATGCPSLLLTGKEGPEINRPKSSKRAVIHATRHGFQAPQGFQAYLYQEAMRLGTDILLQSEQADVYFALNRLSNPSIVKRAGETVCKAYGVEDVEKVAAYLRAHGLFYTNFERWIAGMQERTFCMGTRIHGTVASIVSGTAALLIAHDSRTLEMAQSMHIPYITSSEVPTDRPLDIDHFVDLTDVAPLKGGYQAYWEGFMDFFARNDLAWRQDMGGVGADLQAAATGTS